jgi:hypothetical protein
MKIFQRNVDRHIPILKLSLLVVSLLSNVLLIAYLVQRQISIRRSYRIMRVVAGEHSIAKVKEYLGLPVRIFNQNEETLLSSYYCSSVRMPKITHSAWLYCVNELKWLVYVDKDGYIDNVICR